MNHSTRHPSIFVSVLTLVLMLAASNLQAKPDNESTKDRMDELEASLAELASVVSAQETTIGGLTSLLANQVQFNANQQSKIVSLARHIRNTNALQDYNRTLLGLRQRLIRVQDIIALNEQGLMPPQMPANFLLREIQRMRDVTETLRCTVAGVTPLAGDDCVSSQGEVIEEAVYEVEPASIVVIEGFSSAVSTWSGEVEVTVEDAALIATTSECLSWQADQGNDVKFAFCTASLGLDTAETFTTVLAGMVQASMSLDDFAYVELSSPLNECSIVIEAGDDSVCTDYEDPARATGAWEGITVEGETSPVSGDSTCTVSYTWSNNLNAPSC